MGVRDHAKMIIKNVMNQHSNFSAESQKICILYGKNSLTLLQILRLFSSNLKRKRPVAII